MLVNQQNWTKGKFLKMEKSKCSRLQLVCFTAFLLSAVVSVRSVSLDSDGYYHIVIAINEKTAQNANENYIDNLKAGIQDLSDAVFESTNNSFSIRSADIVLPSHWNIEADAFVTTQNFQNADIRVSHEYSVPQTINPTFCGYPGHHIELPYTYFDAKDTGHYGPIGKSLLTLWARYRWGIFEEHGFPGDSQFPYYWKEWAPWVPVEEGEDPLPEPWKVTNCANAEIKGKFETVDTKQECGPGYVPPEDNTENPVPTTENSVPTTLDPVIEDPDYPPPSECRFIPEIENQTATTSLMSFPYIKSLLNFCDETNHNKRSPNRQNLFCQFKSAWEVIKLSKDWSHLKNPNGSGNTRSPINYRIVKKSEKPLLFVLSDGVNQPPEEVVSTMASQLDVIFDKSEHWNVLASAGVFPGNDTRDSYDTVYQWNTPWHNREELITAFRDSFGSRESTMFRPFGAAIQDIGNKIKEMDHSAGAVIVVIKYGSETDNLLRNQFQVYESEVITTIVTQNIRVFALEGIDNQADSPGTFRLKNLAEMTGGRHFQIGAGNPEQDVQHVSAVMSEVDTILETGSVPSSQYRLAHKDARRSKGDVITTLPVQVNYRNVKSVSFYFHPLMASSDILGLAISGGPDGVIDLPKFEPISQWGKTETQYTSFLAKWTATPKTPLLDPSTWYYTFVGQFVTDTDTYIVVLAELEDDVNEVCADDITIAISTSVDEDENMVDLNVETVASLKGTVFSIYAQLEKNGHPINSPEMEVTAHVLHFMEGIDAEFYTPVKFAATSNLRLMDNGKSDDLTANDGIYSGTFVASNEFGDRGLFQIFVTARLVQTTITKSEPSESYQLTQRCGSSYQGCWSETVTEPFFRSAELTRRIRFMGTDAFVGAASRVLDLRVSHVAQGRYSIEWTEPSLPIGRTNEYLMYFANDFDQLLEENFRDEVYGLPYPSGSPGSTQSIIVDNLEEGENRWYMLKTITLRVTPAPPLVWSNAMFMHASSSFFQTTTTTTTTTTPQPISSTTRLSTVSIGPPTTPTRATTIPSTTTTTRRTVPSTTTRPSTTEPTTTTVRTTLKFEVTTEKSKRWYKAPEAIVTFSIFGVGMFAIAGGLLMYIKMLNRE